MIAGWLSKYEGELLAYFAKRAKGPIVEIGSFQGKSTVAMAKVTKNKIYAIDPHYLKSYQKFLANTKKYKNIIPLKKTSARANIHWSLPISLLHIDGAHEYKFTKQDLQLWLPHLETGGVVICHDAFCPYPDVWRAVKEEIFDKRGWSYIGVLDSQIFAIKGKAKRNWQRPFIILASSIWHQRKIPYPIREFAVKRILKPFYLNKFMLREVFRQSLY